MGNEDGTLVSQFGALNANECVLDHQSHQFFDRFMGDFEGKQRGDGSAHGMSQCPQPIEAFGLGAASSSNDHAVKSGSIQLIFPVVQYNGANRRLHFDFHTFFVSLLHQTIDDGLRIIRLRKHPAIRLCLQRDPPRGEPFHSVLGLKFSECLFELFASSRIILRKGTRRKASVGHIAPATTGNFDFG